MARKVNAYLAKQEAIFNNECRKERIFAQRYIRDQLIVTLYDHLGFGRKRIEDFLEALDNVELEFSKMLIDEVRESDGNRTKGRYRIAGSKEILDRKLREIMGEDWPGWDERYKGL